VLGVLLGRTPAGRDHLVEHANSLSLLQGDWKYIEPGKGPRMNVNTNTELGTAPSLNCTISGKIWAKGTTWRRNIRKESRTWGAAPEDPATGRTGTGTKQE